MSSELGADDDSWCLLVLGRGYLIRNVLGQREKLELDEQIAQTGIVGLLDAQGVEIECDIEIVSYCY